jgi:diaminopimelate decarboxylase
MEFKKLAEKYETPLYIYDFDHFEERFLELKKSFKARKSIIAYAVKANSNLSVISHFAQLGGGADCVSIYEVKRALLAGVDRYRIIFSGVGKRADELEEALKLDILMINVESEGELKLLEQVAQKLGKEARISIRVNPDIDPQTHPYISTGLHSNKFGVDIENAKRLYLYAHKSPHLNPVGIHFHIGSQLTQLEPIGEASQIVADLVRSLKAVNIDIRFFDVGGGIGVTYRDENPFSLYDYAQTILKSLKGLDVTIICEPGRYLTANGGYFLTRVLYEKRNGEKRFIIVDGAMNDLLRPSLYRAYHRIEVVGKGEGGEPADVVGPVCESGDFLGKGVPLPPTEPGDLIVVHSAGAYGFSMASNYNSRPRVAEVAVYRGEDRLIRRRERFEDLIAPEVEFLVSPKPE